MLAPSNKKRLLRLRIERQVAQFEDRRRATPHAAEGGMRWCEQGHHEGDHGRDRHHGLCVGDAFVML